MEAVLNIKGIADRPLTEKLLSSAVVNEFELVHPDRPLENPWQTDTSLGKWHYREGDRYRSARQIVHMLVDIVAYNGNMLLNVAPRGDGTIDERQRRIVEEIGAWLRVNGEAIYATRPWKKAKEGDVRFTRSKSAERLYAISLAWPANGRLAIEALAKGGHEVARVDLLGHEGRLQWRQSDAGLAIDLPARAGPASTPARSGSPLGRAPSGERGAVAAARAGDRRVGIAGPDNCGVGEPA